MILLQILPKKQMQIRCFEIKENNSGAAKKRMTCGQNCGIMFA